MITAFLGFRRGLVSLVAVLAFLTGACSDSQPASDSSGPRDGHGQATRSLEDEVELFMARYPKVIRGEFGTSDTSAYLKIRRPRLTDALYGGTLSVDSLGGPPPTEMPGLSRVVVSGRVLAIGLPHFNSTDGSFWHSDLHEEPGATDVDEMILRDVLFQADEVWGSQLPEIVPGSVVPFVVRGGQIAVDLPKHVAVRLRFTDAGVQIFSEQPTADIAVGEEAVLFLDVRPIFGLYSGKYGARFELAPAYESGFVYIYKDTDTIGLAGGSEFDISISSVQSIVQQQLGQKSDYADAEVGVTYPLGPHPPGQGSRAPIVGVSP
jgi:hypothetical protein